MQRKSFLRNFIVILRSIPHRLRWGTTQNRISKDSRPLVVARGLKPRARKTLKISIFTLILILSFFLRIYKFEKIPPGIDWDEAAVGYNAYSILETARDEHGTFLPLTFKSFGDYKAPLFIYLLVPFIKLFGLTTFALRFPSALFGTLTVLLSFFLTKELFKRSAISYQLSAISSFLLAISPWHLQFSRVAFEPNIALFFVVLGFFLMLKGIRKNSSTLLGFGSFSSGLSLLTYHSSKIFTPFLFLTLLWLNKGKFLKEKKKLFLVLLIFSAVTLPGFLTLFIGGGSRLEAAGIFGKFSTIEEIGKARTEDSGKPFFLVRVLHNRPVVLTMMVLTKYFSHFSPEFLFFGKETNWRVSLPFQGQLYLWEAPFFLLGIYYLLLNFKEKTSFQRKASKLMLFWLLLAPLPASIGQLTPHALRTLLVLPVPQIITAYGLIIFLRLMTRYGKCLCPLIYPVLAGSFLFFTSFYFYNYYVHFPYESGFDWQEGHQEMVEFTRTFEGEVEKIVVTDHYMQPYIFFLWFGKIKPAIYQEKGLKNYEFRAIKWWKDKDEKETLFVGTAEEIPENAKIIKEIRFSNGEIAFRIVKN